jgi:hypothetical protein
MRNIDWRGGLKTGTESRFSARFASIYAIPLAAALFLPMHFRGSGLEQRGIVASIPPGGACDRSSGSPSTCAPADPVAAAAIEKAMTLVGESAVRYGSIKDYTCVLHLRERIGGQLQPARIMEMKARREPFSVYLKFRAPHRGREVLFVDGQHGDKLLARDPGIAGMVLGTLELDPEGMLGQDGGRHPVSHAGIGHMLETISGRWEAELDPAVSRMTIAPGVDLEGRSCTLLEAVHVERRGHFLFAKVRVYIDDEFKLPIRFEAYDWPDSPGAEPPLGEEYHFRDLRVDVGLDASAFHRANPDYCFGE